MRSPIRLSLVCGLLAVAASSCSSSNTCVAGRSEACTCADGSAGMQTCNSAGNAFNECQCAADNCASVGASFCGTHGTCKDGTAGPSCTCAQGYAGADCSACASGYQDNDSDGSCSESCVTAPDCGANGRCSDVTGTATCTCADGYTGAGCAACATGYQDNDTDGVCRPTCATAMLGCGLGGTCTDTSGTATCQCASNTQGATCAQCAPGFQDKDSNNTCEVACASGTCSGHGTCVDTTGPATCTCNTGHTGANCATCATGYQDNDNDGACAPTCATAGLSCDARSACSDATGQAACGCVTGFTAGTLPDGGMGCLFTGGPADPGFQGVPANAWRAPDGGWDFNPDAGGMPNPDSDGAGTVLMTAAARRAANMPLTQQFVLAGAEAREALRLKMLLSPACGGFCFEPSWMIRLNDTFARLPPSFSSGPQVLSLCVGDGAFGSMTTLGISGVGSSSGSNTTFDRVWFEPDTTCPQVGEVINGDFSSTSTRGWTLQGPSTRFVTAGGLNGTGALRIQRPTRCDGASAVTNVSVPRALPNAALRFKLLGTPGRTLTARLDNFSFDVETTSAPVSRSICLTDTMRGRVLPLALSLASAGSGLCSDVDNRFVELDDLEVVSDPASCPASLPMGEGSFEAGAQGRGWFPSASCAPTSCTAGNKVEFVVDPAQARAGNGFAQISVVQRCQNVALSTQVAVPPSNASGGPALRFFYKLPTLNASQSGAAARVFFDQVNRSLAVTPTWRPEIICLDPSMPGRTLDLSFYLSGTSGLCSDTYAADQLSIDDVLVTNDPACPP